MKCYIVGDKYVIEHEKAIHEFERISMDDIITKIAYEVSISKLMEE